MGCGASAPTMKPEKSEDIAGQEGDEKKGFELVAGRKEGRFIVKTKKGANVGLTASGHTTDVDFNGISMSRVDAKAPVKPRKKK